MTAARHISLLVSSGSGPAECEQAVSGVLEVMRGEAALFALDFDISGSPTKHGFRSVVVLVSGVKAEPFAKNWRGTIQWRAQSKLRPTHKRANWFVGVFDLPAPGKYVIVFTRVMSCSKPSVQVAQAGNTRTRPTAPFARHIGQRG